DDAIRADMKARSIPGLVVGVVRDGKLARTGAYGLADVENEVPATVDTVFEIGSISKQFTATAVLLLAKDGKLSLADPLSRFVGGLPEAWRAITIRQLLTHTSGIPDIEEIFGYGAYRNRFTPKEIVDVANSRPVDFAPGEKFHYSNTGYYLLARALEAASEKS